MNGTYGAAVSAAGKRYHELIALAERLDPIRTAVVDPVDETSLEGAAEAQQAGLIRAVLIGPERKIKAVAEQTKVDLSKFELIPAEHRHAAAEKAVEMARAAQVDAIMKGALHTDELMRPVVEKASGLRTERRISHVFALDVPTYPKHLFITDAAINIAPDLEAKRDIVQNAIDLALALEIKEPKVAVLGPVEIVTPKIPATVDAAAVCKMADRGQIRGGIVDGPLAFDNAISEEAARTKGIVSPVAGKADILVVPELNSGNMLAKQLEYLAGALAAGIVLGGRVPIALTSRADTPLTRMASCALAKILAHHKIRTGL
jgi:phosphate acetyltransferase